MPSSRRVQFLASGGLVTNIKVEIQKLELTRHGDFFPPRDKFPRLVRTDAKARSREIKKLLPSL